MLFLGVLSVLQLTLLPGLLLMRLFPGKRSKILQFVLVFTLSLLANYAGVLALVTVGLYLRSVVLVIFAAEVVALVWLHRQQLTKLDGGWERKAKTSVTKHLQAFSGWVKKDFWSAGLYVLFGLIAILGLIWVLSIWVGNFDTVYQKWDAWASWDRWAVKWADNRFPGDTWEYPQLIPVTYSVAYKFIGTTAVKFFGKSIMPLFTLVIGAMLFDLGRKYRSFGYMLGACFALYTINLFLGEYIPEGYVDIPVACFSLMAIYALLQARTVRNLAELKSTLLLGSLATAAAAVTKQTGLYVMAFYPLFAYLWILKDHKDLSRRESIILLGKHFLIALAIVAPWYAFMQYRIMFGGNTSNIQYVISDIYKGQTLPERFVAAVNSLGSYVYYFIFALISLIVLDKRFRHIVVLFIFPFSILWAFFLSYEHRNLAVALPLLAMVVGVAAEAWVMRLRAWLGKRRELRTPAFAVIVLAALLLGAASLVVNDDTLIERQMSEQRKIFEETLNVKIYRYFSSADGPEPIITSYPVAWLPGLESTWVLERFDNYAAYQQTLQNNAAVALLLVPLSGIDDQILAEIQQKIQVGTYELIFTEANHMLVRIPPR